jgi:ABC-2 type transport system ATP-binding protein
MSSSQERNEAGVEVEGLSRSFGETRALDNLTLSLRPGEMFALLGPDGAGKTTAMRLMAGVIRPDAGAIRLAGIDMNADPEGARLHLGYLPQRFSLYGELTVLENLQFLAEVRGLAGAEWRSRAQDMLEFVGLESFVDRRAERLSGGMRQKLGLAACLLHRPPVLLLDEPTGGVDPLARQGFWRLLAQLLREGTAILITTPYMDEAARCSRVGFLDHGRLLVDSTPASLRQPLRGRILELSGPSPDEWIQRVRQAPGVEEALVFGGKIRIRTAPDAGERVDHALREVLQGQAHAPFELRVVAPTLDDVFRILLQSEAAVGS